jgi:hypothetical protein
MHSQAWRVDTMLAADQTQRCSPSLSHHVHPKTARPSALAAH